MLTRRAGSSSCGVQAAPPPSLQQPTAALPANVQHTSTILHRSDSKKSRVRVVCASSVVSCRNGSLDEERQLFLLHSTSIELYRREPSLMRLIIAGADLDEKKKKEPRR